MSDSNQTLPNANPTSISADGQVAGHRLILIVEDEPGVRAMVLTALRLKANRYRVLEAGTASEGVVNARQHRPDLVLLDVALPDYDGFWVCRELKQDPATAGIIVIMLTAMGLPSDQQKAERAGADGYIVKPFSPRALLAELDRRLAD